MLLFKAFFAPVSGKSILRFPECCADMSRQERGCFLAFAFNVLCEDGWTRITKFVANDLLA